MLRFEPGDPVAELAALDRENARYAAGASEVNPRASCVRVDDDARKIGKSGRDLTAYVTGKPPYSIRPYSFACRL